MKKVLKCPVAVGTLALWLALSAVGYLNRDTLYKNYQADLRTTPYFALVFEGIHDGVYPWSGGFGADAGENVPEIPQGSPETVTATEEVQEAEAVADTETETPEVLEFCEVDESYFDDAVFIGDSRTVGLHDYGGLDKATFYATVGLNIYDMWTEEFCEVDGKMVTLEEALRAHRFGKLYFQIGINEMGRGDLDSFMQEYAKSVQKFRELQPDAIIYVEGIMRVTKEKSDTDKIFNNQGIQERNDRIAQLADNRTIFYIDMNEAVCDKNGNLRDDLTFDNLHLLGSKYGLWVDFLKTKGVAPAK